MVTKIAFYQWNYIHDLLISVLVPLSSLLVVYCLLAGSFSSISTFSLSSLLLILSYLSSITSLGRLQHENSSQELDILQRPPLDPDTCPELAHLITFTDYLHTKLWSLLSVMTFLPVLKHVGLLSILFVFVVLPDLKDWPLRCLTLAQPFNLGTDWWTVSNPGWKHI